MPMPLVGGWACTGGGGRANEEQSTPSPSTMEVTGRRESVLIATDMTPYSVCPTASRAPPKALPCPACHTQAPGQVESKN
ncbi:hypothetical protein E2C01_016307 [Portunus trituberculatus]|uniref:Uncharacterized protein n=1 Tax=Portunus trituberculatus TaxID=210409 RepID=A0A5B7DQQ1_PORTR|nr:hypothetical protein [Portunus trituberculatus]